MKVPKPPPIWLAIVIGGIGGLILNLGIKHLKSPLREPFVQQHKCNCTDCGQAIVR